MRFFDKTRYNLGNRGIALILVAASLTFFIIFFLVFLGVAYIYSIRGQLQNAADAGALAGAALLQEGKGPGEQGLARQAAVDFAFENFAAGELVKVIFDGSDTITDNNDITVGHWNVIDETYTPGDTPVNAIEVYARRTENRDEGRFYLFFGDALGWTNMAVTSRAIAFRPPTPSSPLAFCEDSCTELNANQDTGILPEEVRLHFKEARLPLDGVTLLPQVEKGIAWTEYSTSRSTNFGPDSTIARFIRQEEFLLNVCGIFITTNNAAPTQIMTVYEDEFNDEAIPDPPPPGSPPGSRPGWEVSVPILAEGCPPGDQPAEPYEVSHYAFVNITEVINDPSDPGVLIDKILCSPCFIPGPGGGEIPNPDLFLFQGNNTVLVK